MKHCFIVNPAAGNGRDQKAILPRIVNAVKERNADYEIHRTSGPGEATIYTRARIEAHPDEPVRFYACGGDGTVSEVLNGLYGAPSAELAIIPVGSGNDYIRNYGSEKDFLNIAAQFDGEVAPVDVIQYDFTPVSPKGKAFGSRTSYALNMINMGFDAGVVRHMERIKKKSLIKGKGAYISGIVVELTSYKMSRAIFRPAGKENFEADILLAGIGNGRFSGGGFDGIPCAITDDGLLDLMVIEPITRRRFVRLVGAYHDGRHLQHPMLKHLIHLSRVKEAVIEPIPDLIFTADGEIHHTTKPITVSVAPEKVNFVLPKGLNPGDVKRPDVDARAYDQKNCQEKWLDAQ